MIGFGSRATLSNSRSKLLCNRLVLVNSAVLRNWERVPCFDFSKEESNAYSPCSLE